MARSHIAGPLLDDALEVCRSIDSRGWGVTLSPWISPSVHPARAAALYDAALRAIVDECLKSALSIKVPTLDHDRGLLRALLDQAREGCVQVRFDALDPASAEGALRLVEYAAGYYHNIACTLPARWKRSLYDLERVIDWGIALRIVKGQWPDPSAPGIDADENFRSLVDLTAGRCANVSIASHDRPLVHESILKLKRTKTRCEVEQMFSLPVTIRQLALDLDVPLRIYVPFGSPYLPYNVSMFRTRPAIVSWVVRDLLMTKEQKIARLLESHATTHGMPAPPFRYGGKPGITQEESVLHNEV
ncbi:MAG: hypothetical protein HYZ01_01255 [Ignavibacteriales bacterium]|nr:hypothetical protein [Ignavibacteriales bacterium]